MIQKRVLFTAKTNLPLKVPVKFNYLTNRYLHLKNSYLVSKIQFTEIKKHGINM